MTLREELETYAKTTHNGVWERRAGRKVPATEDLALKNEAVDLDATVLYADLSDSTGLVRGWKDWFAAEVYKNYLYSAAKIIRAFEGSITAYDGDRVMAVFVGSFKNTNAAKSALKIRWAVDNILRPAMNQKYSSNKYVLQQKVGIDTSKVMVARTGIRGSNDLVWVGNAANNAAKMAALDTGYSSYITEAVYNQMAESAKNGGNPSQPMWTDLGSSDLGYKIRGSNWNWSL